MQNMEKIFRISSDCQSIQWVYKPSNKWLPSYPRNDPAKLERNL